MLPKAAGWCEAATLDLDRPPQGRSYARCGTVPALFPLCLAAFKLLLDPLVRGSEAGIQRGAWLPIEHPPDQGVVAVAAGHAARCAQIILACELHAGDVLDLRHQSVDRHELA